MDVDKTHTGTKSVRRGFLHEFDSKAVDPIKPIVPRASLRSIPRGLQMLLVHCELGSFGGRNREFGRLRVLD